MPINKIKNLNLFDDLVLNFDPFEANGLADIGTASRLTSGGASRSAVGTASVPASEAVPASGTDSLDSVALQELAKEALTALFGGATPEDMARYQTLFLQSAATQPGARGPAAESDTAQDSPRIAAAAAEDDAAPRIADPDFVPPPPEDPDDGEPPVIGDPDFVAPEQPPTEPVDPPTIQDPASAGSDPGEGAPDAGSTMQALAWLADSSGALHDLSGHLLV